MDELTAYRKKQGVVAACWISVKEYEEWAELVKYGDLGFPLAYAAETDLVELSEAGQEFVVELYNMILQTLELPDKDYESWAEINEAALELQE